MTLVERARIGGVCLNEGCIPSKHLARFAAVKAAAERFAPAGMPALAGTPDMHAFQKRRGAAVDTLVRGVRFLLDGAAVKVIEGNAWFVGRTRVCVQTGEESVRYFDFKDVVIATGSRPIELAGLPFDGARVVEPSRALEWDSVPESLLVAGDDYIALELAVAYARLGSRVTLATYLRPPAPRLRPRPLRGRSARRQVRGVEVVLLVRSAAWSGDAERVVVSAVARRPSLNLTCRRRAARRPSLFNVDDQLGSTVTSSRSAT